MSTFFHFQLNASTLPNSGTDPGFFIKGIQTLVQKGLLNFIVANHFSKRRPLFLNLWTPVAVGAGNTALRTGRTDHSGVPKNNYILEYPWNFVWLQNATHVCIKKISQWKSDIRFCWCKNFSLKQGSGLIGGGGRGEFGNPWPSWIRHCNLNV